jgi:hypothetical protein
MVYVKMVYAIVRQISGAVNFVRIMFVQINVMEVNVLRLVNVFVQQASQEKIVAIDSVLMTVMEMEFALITFVNVVHNLPVWIALLKNVHRTAQIMVNV